MAMDKQEALNAISHTGVVAVIRASSADHLLNIAQALIAGGVVAIEVTMTTPKAISGIEMLADRMGQTAVIGVGTVLDAGTASNAILAGAQFVVSPTFEPEIVRTTRRYGKISIPGAFTPSEIMAAWTGGADVVKVFPSTTLGPGYFKDLLAPLPHLKLTPTGGVDLRNAADWIRAGAAFVGAGSSLVSKQALASEDWPAITASARQFIEAIRAARGAGG